MEKKISEKSDGKKTESPIRILIADSYRSNLILMGHILSNFNCGHDFAKSGWEVLDKLEQGSFDLMFLECHPPEINGYAVVRFPRQAIGKVENQERF
jgi:CheY-like chemotaxis protein